ncbi:MAG: glycine--tRNA ligase subunit beta [Acidobacteria bacterium]|nr:glycine--tRNA ligase subunit beta [Acidobacteriota bacterium]MBW4044814.1 glycine--tRNA ligase subunit beta [Acidobacteriota bacterium]
MATFLFEAGLEEIPARMVAPAQAELARRVVDLLQRERLLGPDAEVKSYSTPRRLTVSLSAVLESQADVIEQLTGPSWSIAFKDGVPTGAAQAFAKKAGVEVGALTKLTNAKGEYVSATVKKPGRKAAEVLTELLPRELTALYWPKNMYWRAGKPERFVRPVKWLLALLDHAIVPIEFAGVHAANLTYGHRILHGGHAVTINHPSDYLAALEAAKVMPDPDARRHKIRKALDAVTRTVPGARWREDEPLVETVTHLTEWPQVVLGGFEPEYLSLPEEVLVTVMRDHQKYFAVEDAAGKLAPHFLAVLNTETDEQGLATIRHGNERVLRARFNDARFFWNFDQKIPLSERLELLKTVTFQKDLGSYHQKTEANLSLVTALAALLRERGVQFDHSALETATRLAKTDLTAELVKEFTELQGVVGGLYARAQGLGETAAQAIYWQYRPASSEDAIPPTVEGQLLGLADRFQTLTAMFALGLEPTGSKDPFALRRAANGVVKILADSALPLTFDELLDASGELSPATRSSLTAFLRERVEFYLREARGIAYDVVNAVLAAGSADLPGAIARAEALSKVRDSADFAAISGAFKRSKNILRQATEKLAFKEEIAATGVVEALLADPAEATLYRETQRLAPLVEELRSRREYGHALEQAATLRPHVDLFFDKVMVMAPEADLRQNRLALIAMVLASFSTIADFSEMVAPVKASSDAA